MVSLSRGINITSAIAFQILAEIKIKKGMKTLNNLVFDGGDLFWEIKILTLNLIYVQHC
jgi:hypothetical protein